jgi:hypothetical protein
MSTPSGGRDTDALAATDPDRAGVVAGEPARGPLGARPAYPEPNRTG